MQILHHYRLWITILFFFVNICRAQVWQIKSSMPTARKGMAVAVLNDKIWVIGGSKKGDHAINTVESYDPAADTWDAGVPDLLRARDNATAQAWDGKIYVFGGRDMHQVVNTVECFDPGSGQWEIVSTLPTPRFGIASVVKDSVIWLCGGTNMNYVNYDMVDIYDPRKNSWTSLPARLNIARGAPMAGVMNGNVFVFGGNFYGPLSNYERFDENSQTWINEGNMLYGCGSAGYISVNNQSWLIGGMTHGGMFNKVQFLTVNNNVGQWNNGPALNVGRRELVAASVNNRIYAIGGRGMMDSQIYNTVEELDAVVGITNKTGVTPKGFLLLSNYPNPFNNTTTILVDLPERDEVRLTLFDINGRKIKRMFSGILPAGEHRFSFNSIGLPLATGVYFIHLRGKKCSRAIKIHLIE